MLLAGLSSSLYGHQLTPTYPTLEQSYAPGILKAEMVLFNSRADIRFYEFQVYYKDWNPVEFAAAEKIVNVEYLERKTIDIFIRRLDETKAVYICSVSKILKGSKQSSIISSRICSKIK